jgi:hypothetical protein
MRLFRAALLLVFLAAACQPAEPQGELPTLAVLPSETPTDEPTTTPTLTETPAPTDIPTISPTPSDTSTPSETPFPSETPRNSPTPRPTIEPTSAAVATGTAAVFEAPRFSTLTPAPGGSQNQPTGTPLVAADIVITEPQFQEEVSNQILSIPSIQAARINFVPGGISVDLTALGGEAYITGRVLVTIELTGDFATIGIGDIQVNAPEPPPAYLETVNGDFFLMMLNVLDTIIIQRLGPEQNLKDIVVTEDAILVTLIVPQP